LIKICVVTNPTSPTTDYYRSVAPLFYLSKITGGDIQIVCTKPSDADWHTFFTSDIVFFSRPNGSALLDIIQEVKKMGKRTWCDYDDLLGELSDYNPAKVHFGREEIIKSVEQIISFADLVTVSTPYLKSKYDEYAQKETVVLKNAYDNFHTRFAPIKPQGDPIKLFWRGSMTHLGDIATVKESIDRLIESPKWRVKFFGLHEWALKPFFPDGYELAGWENRLFTYFDGFKAQKPDWFIYPLVDDSFNQSKSNISAIEAITAGAGVLAPSGFPEFVAPGIINYEDEAHLNELLDKIERKEIDKGETVREGQQWLREFVTVEKENEKRLKLIAGLMGAKVRKLEKKVV